MKLIFIIALSIILSCDKKNPTEIPGRVFETGIVRDIDGHVYHTIKIGDQWWMAENLKVTHYRNGDTLPSVTANTDWINLTTGACCSNQFEENFTSIYGLLYNFYAVNDNRKIAPEGWYVPTDRWRVADTGGLLRW